MPRSGQPPTDIQGDRAEGFELATRLEPMKPRLSPPPRLCEAGPCVHYHRFEVEVDAQQPIPIRNKATGELVMPAQVFHTETHHVCYPTPGIELILGPMPIMTCNRWEPTPNDDSVGGHRWRAAMVKRFSESEAGKEYDQLQKDWLAQREAELRRLADTETASTETEEVPAGRPGRFGAIYVTFPEFGGLETRVEAAWEMTVRDLIVATFAELEGSPARTTFEEIGQVLAAWPSGSSFPPWPLVTIDGEPITNLDATVAHLDLMPGTFILLTKEPIPQ